MSALVAGLTCLAILPAHAAPLDEGFLSSVDDIVQAEMSSAKIPSVSVGISHQGDTVYRSYGDAEQNDKATYQIGSVSKAYTALGILLLEDQGQLSVTDPVSQHLPWFTVSYDGKEVPAADLTIADLLHHTSGFTNNETMYPKATPGMTLEEGIWALSGSKLAFYPGDRYDYANANYNLLGLLIETVSGTTYQDFMITNILNPLGLQQTSVDAETAVNSPDLVPGSRLSFFMAHRYELPVAEGTIPAGYLTATSADLTRWAQIHNGDIEVPAPLARAIAKSHLPDARGTSTTTDPYASGWFVGEQGQLHHSGGTPNYSARVVISASGDTVVTVLTNMNASANTEAIANNIVALAEGLPVTHGTSDIWTTMDTIFTILTIASVLLSALAVIGLVRVARQMHSGRRQRIRNWKRTALFCVVPVLLLALSIAVIVVLPSIFQSTWLAMGMWAPYSLYSGAATFLLCAILLLALGIVAAGHPRAGSPTSPKDADQQWVASA